MTIGSLPRLGRRLYSRKLTLMLQSGELPRDGARRHIKKHETEPEQCLQLVCVCVCEMEAAAAA